MFVTVQRAQCNAVTVSGIFNWLLDHYMCFNADCWTDCTFEIVSEMYFFIQKLTILFLHIMSTCGREGTAPICVSNGDQILHSCCLHIT